MLLARMSPIPLVLILPWPRLSRSYVAQYIMVNEMIQAIVTNMVIVVIQMIMVINNALAPRLAVARNATRVLCRDYVCLYSRSNGCPLWISITYHGDKLPTRKRVKTNFGYKQVDHQCVKSEEKSQH